MEQKNDNQERVVEQVTPLVDESEHQPDATAAAEVVVPGLCDTSLRELT